MRAIFAAGLLLLGGCASAMQPQDQTGIPRPRHQILHINGTFEPVAFTVESGKVPPAGTRAPCQTNDPMPTGGFRQPPSPMPSHPGPSSVAPMPNHCPVTVPAAAKVTRVSTPRPAKRLPQPAPTEPQP